MSIGGGIKFFEPSKVISTTTATGSTGNSAAPYILDRNLFTVWKSVGSNDSTTETLTITFGSSITITRLFLLNHNLKDFDVMYDSSGWTHFSSVVGMDGSKSNITETAFADSSAYYEFASISTTMIRIRGNKTQTVNAEKYLSQLVVSNELGMFSGYPTVEKVLDNRNQKVNKVLSGRSSISKSIETLDLEINFDNYPVAYKADLELMYSLYDLDSHFLVWLCGGRRGSTYFGYTGRGFRLEDVVLMDVANTPEFHYNSNIQTIQPNAAFELSEVIS